MTNALLILTVKQRLNKLDTQDSTNLECWQILEAFNKIQREWTRRQIHGGNIYKEGAEQSTRRIDDLQVLMSTKSLYASDYADHYETESLPIDYMEFRRLAIKAKTSTCPEKNMICYLAQEADVDNLVSDPNRKPSFDWAETFCTLSGSHINVYTSNSFKLTHLQLVYYRFPRKVVFNGCIDIDTQQNATKDITCEFKDDIVDLLIDETVALLAGDIEAISQYQRMSQAPEKNN